jgi:SAM-dependent methyltransferase
LLDQLEIKSGERAFDLGCGPLGILDLLSKKVGPQGEVVGVEWESRFVELAKGVMAGRKLANVKVMVGDATATQLADQSFHLAHERLLLIVVPDPMKVIFEMVRLTQRGGVVVVEDVDISSWFCEPAHPAWTRLFSAFEAVYGRDGKDLWVGRRLVTFEWRRSQQHRLQGAHPPERSWRLSSAAIAGLREAVLAANHRVWLDRRRRIASAVRSAGKTPG